MLHSHAAGTLCGIANQLEEWCVCSGCNQIFLSCSFLFFLLFTILFFLCRVVDDHSHTLNEGYSNLVSTPFLVGCQTIEEHRMPLNWCCCFEFIHDIQIFSFASRYFVVVMIRVCICVRSLYKMMLIAGVVVCLCVSISIRQQRPRWTADERIDRDIVLPFLAAGEWIYIDYLRCRQTCGCHHNQQCVWIKSLSTFSIGCLFHSHITLNCSTRCWRRRWRRMNKYNAEN